MYIYFLISLVLVIMGFGVHKLKWHFLISGYNTMSKEKKENVDIEKISKIIGIYSYILATVFALTGILSAAGTNIMTFSLIFFALATVVMLFMIKKYDFNAAKNTPQKVVSGSLTAIVVILVGILLIYSSRPAKVSFLEEGLQIHGMYGFTVSYSDIKEVRLTDNLPTILSRTNGSAVGSHLRGHFSTKEFGQIKLFVDTKKPPFILFKNSGSVTMINLENADMTGEAYNELINRKN